jgi:hypothetical protein
LSLGTSREDLDTPAFGSAFRSTREQAAWVNDVTLSTTQHIVAGADYSHDRGVHARQHRFRADLRRRPRRRRQLRRWHAQSAR